MLLSSRRQIRTNMEAKDKEKEKAERKAALAAKRGVRMELACRFRTVAAVGNFFVLCSGSSVSDVSEAAVPAFGAAAAECDRCRVSARERANVSLPPWSMLKTRAPRRVCRPRNSPSREVAR